jgi:putative membrane protein
MSRQILAAALVWCGMAFAADIPKDPRSFSEMLHHDNQSEVELAKLAQQKAGSPAVKQFAQMIIEDHQKGDQRLMSFAREQKWQLGEPKANTEKERASKEYEQALKRRLGTLQGAEFDSLYMAAMVEDHDHAIASVAAAKQQFQGSRLGSELQQLLPTLTKHRDHAYQVLGQIKANATGTGGAGSSGSGHGAQTGQPAPRESTNRQGTLSPSMPANSSGSSGTRR